MLLRFSIPGVPQAKQRARVNALLQCKRCGRKTVQKTCPVCQLESDMTYLTSIASTPNETKLYENLVAMCGIEAMKEAGVSSLSGPIKVTTKFYFPIPKSRVKRLKEGDWHCQKPDVDNCKKSCLDGMQDGRVLNNDCTVCWIEATKQWSANPRAEIILEQLESDKPAVDIFLSGTEKHLEGS